MVPAFDKINLVVACARVDCGVLPHDLDNVVARAGVDGGGAFDDLHAVVGVRACELDVGIDSIDFGYLSARGDVLLEQVVINLIVEAAVVVSFDCADVAQGIGRVG